MLRRPGDHRGQPGRARLRRMAGGEGAYRPAICRRCRRVRPLAGHGEGPARCRCGALPHLVHRHGGVLASKLWNVPYVLTIHSLEPLRPWKVEQLGNAYHLSAWMERMAIEQADAIVAVSRETREDLLRLFDVQPERVHVIHNGIDSNEYRPVEELDALIRYGIDPGRPYLLFVGRITKQKGIMHLVIAIPAIDPNLQIVLCAGAPDTPEIAREMADGVARAVAQRSAVIWVREMVSRPDVIQLYSHAAVFCCPSVYEPFGITNLEAMACETAVIASAVGGIPEVVVPNETGLLVDPHLQPGTFDPVDPAAFSRGAARAINRLACDPDLRQQFGIHGRKRAIEHFIWDSSPNEQSNSIDRSSALNAGWDLEMLSLGEYTPHRCAPTSPNRARSLRARGHSSVSGTSPVVLAARSDLGSSRRVTRRARTRQSR